MIAGQSRGAPVNLRSMLVALAAAFVAALPYGCATVNPYYDPAKPHHTPSGFRNNREVGEPKSILQVIHWQWTRELPQSPPGGWAIPRRVLDPALLAGVQSAARVTWIGHSTVLLQMDGVNVITDPHFSDRASPFRWIGPTRATPPAIALTELPRIDLVLVSHNHYDHLDLPSVAQLARQAGGPPRYIVPLGLKRWFAREGIGPVEELDWWSTVEVRGVRVHFVPAHHWSARTRLDRNESLWGGFVVEGSRRFIYVGDTGYSADFKTIAARLGPFDLAAIPIGGYAPRWFMREQHVDPAEAIRIARDLDAKRAFGVHWGTFAGLTDEPLDEPPRLLAQARSAAGLGETFFEAYPIGESRTLE